MADARRPPARSRRPGATAPGAAARRVTMEPDPAGGSCPPGTMGTCHRIELASATRDLVVAGGLFGIALGGSQGADAALRHRGLRGVLRTPDHRQRDTRRAAVGVDR